MNSIALLLWMFAPMPDEQTIRQFDDRVSQYSGGEFRNEAFHYRLLKPLKIEPGVKYPVILYLHGAGERGSDNLKQLSYLPEQMCSIPWRNTHPCFLIAPQCRDGMSWAKKITEVELNEQSTDMLKMAVGILDEIEREFPIDEKRVYLTGLSMGGYGTWELAMRQPKRFAAVVPICGGGDTRLASALVGVPIWAFHGDVDNRVPVEKSREMIAAIKAAGGNPKYTELKDVGHDSWTPAYSDPDGVIKWMFEQKLP
jgi:predicted peptidase